MPGFWGKRRSAAATAMVVLVWCLPALGNDRPRVELAAVEQGPVVEEMSLNGTVTPRRQSRVSVAVAGLVMERAVELGSQVEQGDLLLQLDDELARLERDRAAADTREAQSRLAEARRLLKEARSVGAGRNIAATEVARRESEVRTAQAVLARAEAAQALQEARLRRHRIEAPFSGLISERSVDVGQWVEPGTSVFTLVDGQSLRLDFQVPQQAQSLLNDDSTLRVTAPDGQEQTARISTLVPVASNPSRTFLLRAEPPPDLNLKPGMSVSAVLRLERRDRALSVPRDALNRYPEGRVTVWIARSTDTEGVFEVREQRIRILSMTGDRAFVSDGLEASQQVVSRGNEALSDSIEVELADRELR